MGSYLFPLLVLAIFTGVFAVEATRTSVTLPDQKVIQATGDGQQFVRYCAAVTSYLQSNPAFIGSVSSAALAAQGSQFPTQFLTSSGNAITQIGAGTGRVITCYGNLAPGAVTTALATTDNDASYGIASGGTWTSYAQGAVMAPQALATAVPNGYVVSVVQIGN
jgi:hypothetical protein